MDSNSLPVHTSAAAGASVSLPMSITSTSNGILGEDMSSPSTSMELPIGFDQRLALLQELYQRKHAELLAATQNAAAALAVALPPAAPPVSVPATVPADYLQQLLAQTLGQTQLPTPPFNPLISASDSIFGSGNNIDVEMAPASSSSNNSQQPNEKSSGSSTPSAIRNRRTLSGSGQTISQHTRDRLKSMITKKQKAQRLGSSGSSYGSTSNLSGMNGPASAGPTSGVTNESMTWIPPNLGNSEHDLVAQQLAAAATITGASRPPAVSSATPHFEPYPLPSSANSSNHMSEFQLRKVNSEPNLKMRIRARLLNKGSSPGMNHNPSTPQSATAIGVGVNPFLPGVAGPSSSGHRPLQRCDSDNTVPLESLLRSPIETPLVQAASTSQLPFPPGLMIPSPSLPNLCNGLEQMQLDYTNLMLQNAFTSFLSMPSLLKTQLMPNSILDPQQHLSTESLLTGLEASSSRPTVKFDSRTLSSPLPIGGYPSLLKQQLRDLVLRRKSLVREEPEDEQLMETLNQRIQELSQAAAREAAATAESESDPNEPPRLKTGLVYDAAMSKHQCLCGENQNHVEHGGRVHSIWARLQERGLVDMCERMPVKKVSLDTLKLVHSQTYVTFFAISPTACLKLDPSELPLKSFVQLPCGGIGIDSDTYFNDANTNSATRIAVGCLVELSTQVVEGKIRNGFACIRPPGHHAEREQAMGFCYFNNVSVAARNLQQKHGAHAQRIAIVDWDVHHGNGTQLCFESDPSVLYISLHRHDNGNFFPGTGAVTETGKDAGKGYTVNVAFSGGVMGDTEYLAAWRTLVLPLLDSFQPDFIFVSAGFDATKGHSAALGGYELSPQIFGYFTRTLLNYANGRVVLALEGGYDLPSICDSAEECVKALCADGGDLTRLRPEILEAVPSQAAQDTIHKVIAVHNKQWPCLTGHQGLATSELHWQTISQRFSTLTVHS
uniref:histone deacetylase n=1 Tax=Panagrellus redivivus TaxID=6233 RepID=A0A7E4UZZ3_PANRE